LQSVAGIFQQLIICSS